MLNPELDKLLQDLISQWNIAERRIKKAEQVHGNEVVVPAIFELRYAGRKLIDVLEIVLKKDVRDDTEAHEQARRYLADGIEDCVKAKHDAIDAMVDFVTNWFNEIEQKLGLHPLTELFPEYLDVTSRIADVQDKIAQSRERRGEPRDGVYDSIENDDYQPILQLFNKMRLSRARVQRIAAKQKWREIIVLWSTIIAAIGGIAAVIAVLIEIHKS
jgi:hypothetical protein